MPLRDALTQLEAIVQSAGILPHFPKISSNIASYIVPVTAHNLLQAVSSRIKSHRPLHPLIGQPTVCVLCKGTPPSLAAAEPSASMAAQAATEEPSLQATEEPLEEESRCCVVCWEQPREVGASLGCSTPSPMPSPHRIYLVLLGTPCPCTSAYLVWLWGRARAALDKGPLKDP